MSEELNRERRRLVGLAQRFGLPQTVAGEPFPPSQEGAPLIVDTDVGGPDGAVALVVAATEPALALVITANDGRARFVRHLLDRLGRTDVPVVAGPVLHAESPRPAEAVARVVASADGPVRWAGLGPATNIAALLTGNPALAARLVVTQEVSVPNFRRDPAAAKALLTGGNLPKLVLPDTVQEPEASRSPDGLTLATALQLPFVALRRERVVLDDTGRPVAGPDGDLARISVKVNHRAFRVWLTSRLRIG
ncbi:hypothetical protein [Lentzea sp. NPDC092896]|uniref:hypothetical protein n=1 Tax=Lentzea sp. NPDC092896 TaxID=3364127 RepID=UPI00380538EE